MHAQLHICGSYTSCCSFVTSVNLKITRQKALTSINSYFNSVATLSIKVTPKCSQPNQQYQLIAIKAIQAVKACLA